MAFTTSVSTKGGAKLKAVLAAAEKQRRKSVKVGFFSTAKYDDGTPVAAVAAINEFGLAETPERPFFRQAVAELERGLPKELRGIIDPLTMDVSDADAHRIGAYAAGVLRDRIDALKDPANAQSTIELKGSSNPLVASEKLKDSADYEVE